ncbi:MAG: M28 family peptidase, partial [Candidatus Methylomirabilales bacterium]
MRRPSATSRHVPLLALLLAGCAGGSSHLAVHWSAAAEALLAPADLLRHVEVLAGPAMEGRASGTPGGERAAAYIAAEFARAGLTPGGEGGSYFQPFEVITGIRLGPANALHFDGLPAPPTPSPVVGQDFIPLSFSTEGSVEGEILFVGYGITAPELGYDDYAGRDATGKVVLVMTHEPRERDEGSPFRRPEAYRHTEARTKVTTAREHGAVAVLLVRDPINHRDEPEELIGLRGASSSRSSLLAVNLTTALADRLLAAAGKRLADLQTAIDASLAPQSLSLPGVRVRLSVDLIREKGRAVNVVGLLPGRDAALRETAVVLGAHYDHLGRGGEASLNPAAFGAIHPGADDNASGTAAVLGLARAFAAAGGAPRTLVFAAFAGEEMGLLGSSFYTKQPPIPLEKTVAMLNLDMVGRLRDRKVLVGGVETAREWPG